MYAKYIQDKCSAVAEMGDRLTTIDMGRKEGATVPFLGVGLGPHLTQCMAWAEVYLSTKWHSDPSSRLTTTDMSRKLWGIYDQFSANVRCGQTAGWTKMPLRVEVGLGPGDVVLDGVAAPPKRGHNPFPVFGSYLLWPNGWMDEDATW